MTDSHGLVTPSTLLLLPERIIEKIRIRPDGCWEWLGALSKPTEANPNAGGYGRVRLPGGHEYAHRYVFRTIVGPIPKKRPELDHLCCSPEWCPGGGLLCPHRRCVNPTDLEPVTRLENRRRAARPHATCDDGHPFDAVNTRVNPRDGRRICRACDAQRARIRRALASVG